MLLYVCLLTLLALGQGRVLEIEDKYFEEGDSITIEAREPTRDGRNLNFISQFGEPPFVRMPFPTPSVPVIQPFPMLGQFKIPENPCWNDDGKFGTCMDVTSCYPYVKVFNKTVLRDSIMDDSGTCAYLSKINKSGERGVCCISNNVIQPPFVPVQTLPIAIPQPGPELPPVVMPVAMPVEAEQVVTAKVPESGVDRQAGLSGICGFKGTGGKIVGGVRAEPYEWPWMVALMNGNKQFCGGSLIDNIHILTAAHCVAHMTSFDVARLRVRLNEYNLKQENEGGLNTLVLRVRRVTRHKRFDGKTLYNDIALLTLEQEVSFAPGISPVCLPNAGASDSYAGVRATVTGWGSLREGGAQPEVLMKVDVTVQTNALCSRNYGTDAPGGIIDTFLCASDSGKDSCSGDSGGPLIIPQGQQWTQVGVVSWGIGCGQPPYPGVYTRVTSFMNWILANLSK